MSSQGFGGYNNAMRMRDLFRQIAAGVVEHRRPLPRIGEVYDFNRAARTADVLFPGDADPVRVRFFRAIQPRRKNMDLADGSAPGDVVRVEGRAGNLYITEIVRGLPYMEGAIPAGVSLPYGGIILPEGFFWENGDEYLKADYPELYAAIGDQAVTVQGLAATSGPDYFRVFNAVDRMIVGAGAAKALATIGGAWTRALAVGDIPPHNHSIQHDHANTALGGTHTHDYTWRDNATGGAAQTNIMSAGGTAGTVVTKRSAGTGSSDHQHNIPNFSGDSGNGTVNGLGVSAVDITNKYLAKNWIIKY